MTEEEFARYIPLHCPRFKKSLDSFLYEIGNALEEPFLAMDLSHFHIRISAKTIISNDSRASWYQVMCRDAAEAWREKLTEEIEGDKRVSYTEELCLKIDFWRKAARKCVEVKDEKA